MCPACIANAAVIAIGAISPVGLSAFPLKKLRTKDRRDGISQPKQRRMEDE